MDQTSERPGGGPQTTHRVERRAGGLSVHEYKGSGPTFVLMHGFPDNVHIYDDLVPHLVAAGRHVVAFDFLGFGASDKPPADAYGFRQQVEDLAAVVEALALDRIVPVAHDSSGPAAINYAVEHPDRVASLCLLNTFYGQTPGARYPELIELFATRSLGALTRAIMQSPEVFGWVLNFQRAAFQRNLPPEQVEHYVKFLGPLIDANFRQVPGSGPAFARMTSLLFDEEAENTERLDAVRGLKIPVKLIWGETDPYLDRGVAEHLASQFATSTLDFLKAGHWVQVDVPEKVARLMLA